MWLLAESLWACAFAVCVAPWLRVILGRNGPLSEELSLAFSMGYVLAALTGWVALVTGAGPVAVRAACVAVFGAGLVARRRSGFLVEREGLWVVFAVLCALLPRAYYQLKVGPWPRGWDPLFHLSLIRAAELQHGIPWTLRPFDDVAVNYPWGTHLAVIGQQRMADGTHHVAFAAQNSVLCGVGSVLAVAGLTSRLAGSALPGAVAGAVYGGLMHFGSADYQTWGGLPNQAAMMVFLAGFTLWSSPLGKRDGVVGVGLVGASFVMHHHVMLVALASMGMHAAIVFTSSRDAVVLRNHVRDVVMTILAGGIVTVPLLTRVGGVGSSRMLHFKESFQWFTSWSDSPGIPGLIAGVVGICVVARLPQRDRFLPALSMLAALALSFSVLGGMWRVFMRTANGEPAVAMTPSRFLTDSAYPLAVLAGCALVGAGRRSLVIAALAIPIVVGEQWMWMKARDDEKVPSQAVIDSALELGERLPGDAFVVGQFHGHAVGAYLFAREVHDLPRPVSEPPSTRSERQKLLGSTVLRGEFPEQLKHDLIGDRPIFIVTDRALPPIATQVDQEGPLRVGRVDSPTRNAP